jgi:hypothetical protein
VAVQPLAGDERVQPFIRARDRMKERRDANDDDGDRDDERGGEAPVRVTPEPRRD